MDLEQIKTAAFYDELEKIALSRNTMMSAVEKIEKMNIDPFSRKGYQARAITHGVSTRAMKNLQAAGSRFRDMIAAGKKRVADLNLTLAADKKAFGKYYLE